MARVPWFRMYSEVLHDPKIQTLSPTDFKHWVNLLCLGSESEPRGSLPADTGVAFALRITPYKASQLLCQFHERGLIDIEDGCYLIHGWNKRQFASDDVTTRVERFRKKSNVASNDIETLHETPPEAEQIADTETEPETDSRAEQLAKRRRVKTAWTNKCGFLPKIYL